MNEYFEAALNLAKKLPVIGDVLENRPKVAVIRFAGVIADASVRKQGVSYSRFAKVIDKAFDKPGVRAVALVINSPGGSPAQTSLISTHIRRLAEEKDIPVYAFVEDVAASGGYWLACAADEIYAQESSIVGSIGVVSASFGFEDFIEQYGIHRRLHTSGKDKSFLDPFVPEAKNDLERLTQIQKEIHRSFKAWVRHRRDGKIDESDKALFEGAFWTAGPAIDKGLIDGVGDMRSVIKEKIDEKVRFMDLAPERKFSLFGPLGIGAAVQQDSFADDILGALETRAFWSRYGL